MVGDAQARLRERSPFGLMAMASGLIEATTPRPSDSWGRGVVERPDGPSTFESFAVSGWPAMEALALAVAVLHPDELLARRLRAAVDVGQITGGANWLRSMGVISVTDTIVHRDPLGDGENVAVSWRWPDGQAATALVYVDHNMGTVVTDAFVIPESAAALAATYARHGDPHITASPIAPADARARITEAVVSGERMVPPFETDTWPACRPMVEWALRHLPDGGVGYVRPEWSEADRDRLLDDFARSAFAKLRGLSTTQVRELADPLVWFACDYGPGDPLRWSPVSVEIVLTDWYPRKVFAVPELELRRLPEILAGFVRFAHDRRDIPTELTADTLAAVERWRQEFLAAIARPGRSPEANAIRLARFGAGLDPDGYDDLDDDDEVVFFDDSDDDSYMAGVVEDLETTVVDLVGGRAAYDALGDEPLDDVPVDWSTVPEALRQLTSETLVQLDGWAAELFDTEVRTIARHVLAGVVVADPGVFKRSTRTDALAAAILSFLLGRLTGRFSAKERRQFPWKVFTQKDLAAATGVSASTIGSRTKTIANVVERADIDWPNLLHSTQRREALRTKEHVAEWRRAHPGYAADRH